MLQHKRDGLPVVVEVGGQIKSVDPHDIDF